MGWTSVECKQQGKKERRLLRESKSKKERPRRKAELGDEAVGEDR